MKKRLLTVLLSAAMTMAVLTGCAGSKAAVTEAQSETASEAPTEEKTYKVAMICDSTIADGGWGAACYNAMVAAAEENGFETQYSDGIDIADFATNLRSYADLGFDLIFAPGNQYTDAVVEVSADYPDVYFALLNGTVETDNVVSLLPDAKQIGYMAGALAGLISETGNIGFIGGMELDTTKTKLECYEAGAKKINPDITVSSAYAGSFSDTARGMEIANSMVTTNDVDVMFGDASAVDSGAREALAGYENRFDIGQPSDLLAEQESDVIVSSVVTDNAAMIALCMEDIKNGTYGNKTIYGDLSNGCLSVGTFHNSVSEEIKTQYLEYVEQIKEGTFLQ
ncbi:MAG: BMP family protein [Lachnospiraceae bacterium]